MCDDGDEGALESIAGFLCNASVEEQDSLAAAVERAIAAEFREEFVRDYKTWMDDMFIDGKDRKKFAVGLFRASLMSIILVTATNTA
jgi:hypothetical protein